MLSYFEKHEQVTTKELSAIFELSGARVRAILQELTNDGKIEKIGNNRYAYYILKK
jgi:predicted transcriptional regulator of viral defense system